MLNLKHSILNKWSKAAEPRLTLTNVPPPIEREIRERKQREGEGGIDIRREGDGEEEGEIFNMWTLWSFK